MANMSVSLKRHPRTQSIRGSCKWVVLDLTFKPAFKFTTLHDLLLISVAGPGFICHMGLG